MRRHSLAHVGTRSHLRAVAAIARKDLIHFYRYPLNALFRVVEPVMWLTPIYFLGRSFGPAGGQSGFAGYSGTADYMSFVLVGTVITSYVSAVFWGMGYALKNEMDQGVLETNWMAPLPRPLLLFGQTLASLAITTINVAGVLLLARLIFGLSITGGLLESVPVLLLVLAALYGFGFAFAAVVLLLRDANTLIDISNFSVSILSGSQFPVTVLPRALLPIALALPLTYGYDALRGLLLDSRTLLPIGVEVGILAAFVLLMAGLGSLVFARVERRCRALGTLGQH